MKKLLLASVLSLAPAMTLAIPVCNTSDPNFCSCLITNAISNCLQNGPSHHIPPSLCKQNYILPHIRTTPNIEGFCTQYSYMFPPQATHADCVSGITYAKAHC